MDFFKSQDEARRRARLLIVYFVLAIVGIILSVYFAVVVSFFSFSDSPALVSFSHLWNSKLFFIVSAVTITIVFLGSLFKTYSLRSGGSAVAIALGGIRVNPATNDLAERRLLNVVSEMSIASGVRMPEVYILKENAINAFAAGFTPDSAVIGVTRGCIKKLTRDELQGVIAHEFSHILNGDMRLNIRLIGTVHGILLLAIVGRIILRSLSRGSNRSSKSKGNGGIVVFALLLLTIGYVGVFFGKLIKSAVSRQREYLADASAVQFTRNPMGIAGALKKIGGLNVGSKIKNPHAEEASHMFFANGLSKSFISLFATHPPLAERIKRIDHSFDGDFLDEVSDLEEEAEIDTPQSFIAQQTLAVSSNKIVESIGAISESQLHYSRAMLSAISKELKQLIEQKLYAISLIYSLLLAKEQKVRTLQLEQIKKFDNSTSRIEAIARIEQLVSSIGAEFRIPLIELSLNAIKEMNMEEYQSFKETIVNLIKADEQIEVFEYVVARIVLNALKLKYEPNTIFKGSLAESEVTKDIEVLLSVLSYEGQKDFNCASEAFNVASDTFTNNAKLKIRPKNEVSLSKLDLSLDRLVCLKPQSKKKIIEASLLCIRHDGVVNINEAELFRAISVSLGVPMPPLLAA